MRTCQTVLALAVVSLAGCMTYRPRDVIVAVRDAETHAPVPNAIVHVSMPHAGDEGKTETTLPNGMARVVFTPSTGEPVMIEATAAGYISDSTVAGEPVVAAVANYPIVGPALPHKPDFTLELYAGPKFGVEIVVPPTYRGLVKTNFDFRDDVSIPKAQRLWSFDVTANGEVKGTGPAILKKVSPSDYRVRLANATMPLEENPEGLALRWLKREDTQDVFYFGTKAEYEQYRKDNKIESPSNPPSSDGGKKGGRGGGRRRGGS
jgi:hypothetical protein